MFSGSINNVFISGYTGVYPYMKYDVVKADNYYFVAAQDSSGQLNESTYQSNAYWKRIDESGFNFTSIWTPTYQTSINLDLKPKVTTFGDGYAQRSEAGVFFNKQAYQLEFKNIPTRELKSLIAFFEYRGGKEMFVADINSFSSGRRFIGQNWNHNYVYSDLNDFSVNIFEYVGE